MMLPLANAEVPVSIQCANHVGLPQHATWIGDASHVPLNLHAPCRDIASQSWTVLPGVTVTVPPARAKDDRARDQFWDLQPEESKPFAACRGSFPHAIPCSGDWSPSVLLCHQPSGCVPGNISVGDSPPFCINEVGHWRTHGSQPLLQGNQCFEPTGMWATSVYHNALTMDSCLDVKSFPSVDSLTLVAGHGGFPHPTPGFAVGFQPHLLPKPPPCMLPGLIQSGDSWNLPAGDIMPWRNPGQQCAAHANRCFDPTGMRATPVYHNALLLHAVETSPPTTEEVRWHSVQCLVSHSVQGSCITPALPVVVMPHADGVCHEGSKISQIERWALGLAFP